MNASRRSLSREWTWHGRLAKAADEGERITGNPWTTRTMRERMVEPKGTWKLRDEVSEVSSKSLTETNVFSSPEFLQIHSGV